MGAGPLSGGRKVHGREVTDTANVDAHLRSLVVKARWQTLDRSAEKIKCSLSLLPCLTQGASVKSQVPCTQSGVSPGIAGNPTSDHPHCLRRQEDTQPETHSRVSSVSFLVQSVRLGYSCALDQRESGPQKPSQVCLGSLPFASGTSRLLEISTLPWFPGPLQAIFPRSSQFHAWWFSTFDAH